MQAYHSFAREQRPLLSKGRSPGGRERLLSQRWKALSKAEKAHYKGCEDAILTPSFVAYSAFCLSQRPLLPRTLSNSQREANLGLLWAALPEGERAEYRVGGSRVAVPTGSAPEPVFALTAPSSASTSLTASHSLSTDTNDDGYEWGKYLSLDEGFISSSLDSLDALHVQETSEVLMEQLSACACTWRACMRVRAADSYRTLRLPYFILCTCALLALIYICCMPLAGESALAVTNTARRRCHLVHRPLPTLPATPA